jgi:hypothetical protein
VTLTGANLTGVDLTNTTIDTRTKFTGANLTGVNLTGKNLTGFTLSGMNLTRANLTGANLTDAILTGANLADANLTDANLTRADLYRANILNTTLTAVVWRDTRCPDGSKSSSGCKPAPVTAGRAGNDWFAPDPNPDPNAPARSYVADGGPGSDLYTLFKSGTQLLIDGRYQSGTDAVVFYGDLQGSDITVEDKRESGGGVTVSYTSKASNSHTTLIITNADLWRPSDVFYTKNVNGRLTLERVPDVKIGPSS